MNKLFNGLKERFTIFLVFSFCIAVALPNTGLSQWSSEIIQTVVSSVVPSDANPDPGDQITVAINFDMTGMPSPNENLGSFTATLNWDPSVLSFVSHGGVLQGFVGVVNTTQASNGVIIFNGANPLGATGIFDIIVFTFDVPGAIGTSTVLDLEYSAMAAALTFIDLLPFLTVNDATVTVGPIVVNMPPQLTPIPDQTMDEGTTLDVPVSATDPDMNNITLSVTNLPAFGTLTDNGDGTGTISFAPGFDDAGTYSMIEVIATDDGTPVMADTVYFDLTVNNVNRPPDLAPIPDQTMSVNQTLDVSVTATDPDMDNITLTANNLPSFGSFVDNGDGTGTISFAPLTGDDGVYPNIEITATDDGTPSPLSDTESFTLTVNPAPTAQVVSSAIPSNANPNSGDQITVAINFDMTGMSSTADSLLGSFTGTINWDPTVLSFVSHSGILQGFVGVVNTTQAGNGVIIYNGANPLGVNGVFDVLVITFDVTGASGDSTVLDLEYSAMAAALTFNDLLPFLTINDGLVKVGVIPPNDPPVLDSIPDQTMVEGTTLNVPITAMDPNMDNITLSTNNLPAFGTLTDNGDGTGSITFMPGFTDAGVYPDIQVIATDDGTPSLSDTVAFTLTVLDSPIVNNPPVCQLNPPGPFVIDENQSLTFDVMASDPDAGDVITLDVMGLPAGATMTPALPLSGPNTGVSSTFDWTPASGQAGNYIVTYTVTDSAGLSSTCIADITVDTTIITDIDPPLCALTNIIPGPPKAIEITVQDTGSGLGQVNVISTKNATVNIPPFTPGTTDPVIIVATKIDQNQSSTVTLEVIDVAGNTTVCDPVYTTIAATIPEYYELKQNFPNPFNPTTTIHFNITEDIEGINNVSLRVFDLTGREIKTLINEAIQPGQYSVDWDGTNNRGEQVAGGVYIYRLVAGDFTATKKMILMK